MLKAANVQLVLQLPSHLWQFSINHGVISSIKTQGIVGQLAHVCRGVVVGNAPGPTEQQGVVHHADWGGVHVASDVSICPHQEHTPDLGLVRSGEQGRLKPERIQQPCR